MRKIFGYTMQMYGIVLIYRREVCRVVAVVPLFGIDILGISFFYYTFVDTSEYI